jgi:hypothetical protein
VDPDQDLLDKLDRREAGGLYFVSAVVIALAALTGIIAYFALMLELHINRDVAFDSGVLVFIGSACLFGASYRRFS